MYEYIRGQVVSRADDGAVLETGGIAYRLSCSVSTLRQVPPKGEFVLYTHLVVREDRHEFFGFADHAERHLFRQLLRVSGVGPAVALALLSAYEPAALASHIAAGELAFLTRAKGIGKRTAERIVVELRDKVAKERGTTAGAPAGVRTDAVLALCSLGLPRSEAERRVATVDEDKLGLELEEVVKQALR